MEIRFILFICFSYVAVVVVPFFSFNLFMINVMMMWCGQVATPTPTRLFSFMNPLAVEIWLFLLLAYVLVSLSMWVVARFTPYEWHETGGTGRCHHCHQIVNHSNCTHNNHSMVMVSEHHQQAQSNNGSSINDFSLANSFWFTIGTLMQQGSDLNPKVHTVLCNEALPLLLSFYIPRLIYY